MNQTLPPKYGFIDLQFHLTFSQGAFLKALLLKQAFDLAWDNTYEGADYNTFVLCEPDSVVLYLSYAPNQPSDTHAVLLERIRKQLFELSPLKLDETEYRELIKSAVESFFENPLEYYYLRTTLDGYDQASVNLWRILWSEINVHGPEDIVNQISEMDFYNISLEQLHSFYLALFSNAIMTLDVFGIDYEPIEAVMRSWGLEFWAMTDNEITYTSVSQTRVILSETPQAIVVYQVPQAINHLEFENLPWFEVEPFIVREFEKVGWEVDLVFAPTRHLLCFVCKAFRDGQTPQDFGVVVEQMLITWRLQPLKMCHFFQYWRTYRKYRKFLKLTPKFTKIATLIAENH